MQHFNAGMLAGVMTTVVMTPGERIKCMMQVCPVFHVHVVLKAVVLTYDN